MGEKTDVSEDEQSPVERQRISGLNDDCAKPIPNGGLQAWLSVLAGFCVFVNSW